MSSGKTEHYQLHLWNPEDSFVRVEFNENNQKVDAALAAKCEEGAFQTHKAAIEAAVASKADNAAFQAHKSAIEAAVASKVDNSTFQAHKSSIEAVAASKADNAAFQALKQSVESTVPAKCEIQVGTYVGNWTQAAPHQHIVLGRRPKAVIVWGSGLFRTQSNYGPMYSMGIDGCAGAAVEITADGFIAHRDSDGGGDYFPNLNNSGMTYMYLAIF